MGGIVRAKKLSEQRRKEIITKASKAGAKARTAKAKARKRQLGRSGSRLLERDAPHTEAQASLKRLFD